MPRPHLLMERRGRIMPHDVLDPRFHPLGQPGPRHAPKWLFKVPVGLRVPVLVFVYCNVCWVMRHWLYPYGPRTVANVRIPIYDQRVVDGMWERRFRTQEDIYAWGHIYHAMQERRLTEARNKGLIPSDVTNASAKIGDVVDRSHNY